MLRVRAQRQEQPLRGRGVGRAEGDARVLIVRGGRRRGRGRGLGRVEGLAARRKDRRERPVRSRARVRVGASGPPLAGPARGLARTLLPGVLPPRAVRRVQHLEPRRRRVVGSRRRRRLRRGGVSLFVVGGVLRLGRFGLGRRRRSGSARRAPVPPPLRRVAALGGFPAGPERVVVSAFAAFARRGSLVRRHRARARSRVPRVGGRVSLERGGCVSLPLRVGGSVLGGDRGPV